MGACGEAASRPLHLASLHEQPQPRLLDEATLVLPAGGERVDAEERAHELIPASEEAERHVDARVVRELEPRQLLHREPLAADSRLDALAHGRAAPHVGEERAVWRGQIGRGLPLAKAADGVAAAMHAEQVQHHRLVDAARTVDPHRARLRFRGEAELRRRRRQEAVHPPHQQRRRDLWRVGARRLANAGDIVHPDEGLKRPLERLQRAHLLVRVAGAHTVPRRLDQATRLAGERDVQPHKPVLLFKAHEALARHDAPHPA
mmetsp:Transcript_50327/g.166654  ORF Transcript_50327/g.166654 Transcript_50327/m.166654 type:complete len:261 (+) Transcript_50327:158-940(+)